MELNVVNGGSQVLVAPATARAARMLLGACGRCAALLGRLHACGARMHVGSVPRGKQSQLLAVREAVQRAFRFSEVLSSQTG